MISPCAVLAIALLILAFAGRGIVYSYKKVSDPSTDHRGSKSDDRRIKKGTTGGEQLRKDAWAKPVEIQSRPEFDWKTTQPMQFRPFKPIYYITMGTNPLETQSS